MSPTRRRLLYRALQLLFVVAVFVYGGGVIARQWREIQQGADTALLDLRWLPLLGATALVFLTYLLLVQLWRYVLRTWNASLPLGSALRIWFVSNLGRFVPGRVAQIGAMYAMARDRGVSPAAATGSAILNTLLNIAAGFAVAVATGGYRLEEYSLGVARPEALLVLAAATLVLLLPWLLPRAARLVNRLRGRELPVPELPARAVWLTVGGNVVAWLAYGVAFQLFAWGVLGEAAGATTAYIAVYTGSYIIGYLFVLAPGGIGAREAAMVVLLQAFSLATEPTAWLLAFASRIWLTVLEVLPGVLFLALGAVRPRPPLTSGDAPS